MLHVVNRRRVDAIGQGTVTRNGRCWWEKTHFRVVKELPLKGQVEQQEQLPMVPQLPLVGQRMVNYSGQGRFTSSGRETS